MAGHGRLRCQAASVLLHLLLLLLLCLEHRLGRERVREEEVLLAFVAGLAHHLLLMLVLLLGKVLVHEELVVDFLELFLVATFALVELHLLLVGQARGWSAGARARHCPLATVELLRRRSRPPQRLLRLIMRLWHERLLQVVIQ